MKKKKKKWRWLIPPKKSKDGLMSVGIIEFDLSKFIPKRKHKIKF